MTFTYVSYGPTVLGMNVGVVTTIKYRWSSPCHVAVTVPTRPFQLKMGTALATSPVQHALPQENSQLPGSLSDAGLLAAYAPAFVVLARNMASPLIHEQFEFGFFAKQPIPTMYLLFCVRRQSKIARTSART